SSGEAESSGSEPAFSAPKKPEGAKKEEAPRASAPSDLRSAEGGRQPEGHLDLRSAEGGRQPEGHLDLRSAEGGRQPEGHLDLRSAEGGRQPEGHLDLRSAAADSPKGTANKSNGEAA